MSMKFIKYSDRVFLFTKSPVHATAVDVVAAA